MVQLNTTYDSSIHQKVFVLKGDEAYARTTDTIATLITDFGDFDNHISYCHVGLEIQVLRELGNSNLLIYCDDELLYTIPWSNDHMSEIIDSDWNEKGVYWENGKLLIGKYSLNPLVNTGLYLLYDVEHKIEVRYEPNEYCLGSSAKPIVFKVPTPETFASTLTLSSESQRYASSSDVDDIELLFECENDTQYSKSVLIYDGDTLIDTVTVEQDTPLTLDLGVLDDGLHTIKAVFNGDGEAYASETEYQISVGYKIINLEYPSYVIQGNTGALSCNVLDYFDEPYVGLNITVAEYIPNWGWETISSQSATDGYGFVNIEPVYYSAREFAITDGYWYGERHTTPIIEVGGIQVAFNEPITPSVRSRYGDWTQATNTITATVMGANNQPLQVADMPLVVELESFLPTQTWESLTNANGVYSQLLTTNNPREITATVTLKGTQISNTAKWTVPEYWWSSSNNKQEGSYTADGGMNVIKVSNGFKFDSNTSSIKNAYFMYGSNEGVYRIEFDSIAHTSYGEEGVYFCGRQYSIGSGYHFKLIHDIDNGTVQAYVNGRMTVNWSFNEKRFQLGCKNLQYIIDNLVIVREE